MSVHPVVVVGAGIVGASIAYHLASRGADVVLVDAGLPGSGATRHSFGWIGRTPGDASPHGTLRELGRCHWQRLAGEVPGLEVHWSGALVWGEFFAAGDAVQDDQAAAHEPGLISPPALSAFRPDDGWLDPTRAAETLVRAARFHGARVRFGAPVTRLDRAGDGAVVGVRLGSEAVAASTVVVASGTGSAALCATVGIDVNMVSSPAVMVRVHAPKGIVRGIVANDRFEARQGADGTVLIPLDYTGEASTEALMRVGEEARRLFVASFRDAAEARVQSVEIGWRPMLADAEPRIGSLGVPGLYVAVAHPGITLASVIGDIAADEILTHLS